MTAYDIAYRCFNEFIERHGIAPNEFWMDLATLKHLEGLLLTEYRHVEAGPFSNRFLFGLPIQIAAEPGITAALSVRGTLKSGPGWEQLDFNPK